MFADTVFHLNFVNFSPNHKILNAAPIEHISRESLKAKTRVIITNDQSEQRRHHKKPMRTREKINKLPKARENAGDRVVIGLSLLIDQKGGVF